MADNTVITDVVIPAHATVATVALVLGAYNLMRRRKGDRAHRRVGRIWVVAMYATVLSSFAIRDLRPGHFSWIHGLSVFTFGTLTVGLWAARTGRVDVHRRFITGSYLGLVGAFAGAVAVRSRRIPQWAVHEPAVFFPAAAACLVFALAVLALARRGRQPEPPPAGPSVRTAAGLGQ